MLALVKIVRTKIRILLKSLLHPTRGNGTCLSPLAQPYTPSAGPAVQQVSPSSGSCFGLRTQQSVEYSFYPSIQTHAQQSPFNLHLTRLWTPCPQPRELPHHPFSRPHQSMSGFVRACCCRAIHTSTNRACKVLRTLLVTLDHLMEHSPASGREAYSLRPVRIEDSLMIAFPNRLPQQFRPLRAPLQEQVLVAPRYRSRIRDGPIPADLVKEHIFLRIESGKELASLVKPVSQRRKSDRRQQESSTNTTPNGSMSKSGLEAPSRPSSPSHGSLLFAEAMHEHHPRRRHRPKLTHGPRIMHLPQQHPTRRHHNVARRRIAAYDMTRKRERGVQLDFGNGQHALLLVAKDAPADLFKNIHHRFEVETLIHITGVTALQVMQKHFLYFGRGSG